MPGSSAWLGLCCFFFFFNDTATTEIYTLSLHDALPISAHLLRLDQGRDRLYRGRLPDRSEEHTSELQSRVDISYAVFCLKKTHSHSRSGPTLRYADGDRTGRDVRHR